MGAVRVVRAVRVMSEVTPPLVPVRGVAEVQTPTHGRRYGVVISLVGGAAVALAVPLIGPLIGPLIVPVVAPVVATDTVAVTVAVAATVVLAVVAAAVGPRGPAV